MKIIFFNCTSGKRLMFKLYKKLKTKQNKTNKKKPKIRQQTTKLAIQKPNK